MCAKIGAVLLSSEITPWRQRRWRYLTFDLENSGHFCLILGFLGFVLHPTSAVSFLYKAITLSLSIIIICFHVAIAYFDTNENICCC
jgi:hypothetical protein